MFSKKLIEKTVKEYKTQGILPDIWGKDSEAADEYTKVAFIMMLEKVLDGDKKDLKNQLEDNLTSSGFKTEYLTITYKDTYASVSVNKEGKEYLEKNFPAFMEKRTNKASFVWKLR